MFATFSTSAFERNFHLKFEIHGLTINKDFDSKLFKEYICKSELRNLIAKSSKKKDIRLGT